MLTLDFNTRHQIVVFALVVVRIIHKCEGMAWSVINWMSSSTRYEMVAIPWVSIITDRPTIAKVH